MRYLTVDEAISEGVDIVLIAILNYLEHNLIETTADGIIVRLRSMDKLEAGNIYGVLISGVDFSEEIEITDPGNNLIVKQPF